VTSGTTTVISGRLSDNVSNRIFVAIPPFISMTAGLLLLAFVPRLEVLFLATAMIGVGSGGIGPALLALVGDLSPGDEVGRMGSVYNIMGDVGSTAGPLLAVPMVDSWFGFQVSYVSYAIGVALTAIVVTVPLLRWNVARSDPSDVTDV
ncbi:MAG: MFS transporter, partial [Natronomonas sp.]